MPEATAYQYVTLGSKLEFLRGISSKSLTQATSLVAFPNLLENLPAQRYTVRRVVGVVRSLLGQLEEMKLDKSLRVAEGFRPMLEQMQKFLEKTAIPETALFQDQFAENLAVISKQVAIALEAELGETSA